ncbi:hypothetical protein PVAND_011778 [Polypedilum vanderplanki]|uniref:Coiled-coil domain-containing protein 39 n=1 Tax=Polypedilum vanderplanki TaxID=319348 RepID=A0A9J6CJN6_POLVA|nr:hypothetical protein PVAND_011778 [Polypedilum vanderplanki]
METELENIRENNLIKEVMESIGWSDSFLPIVNKNNRKLLATIKILSKSKLEHEGAFEAHKKELKRIEDLFKYADNEFNQNLKLLNAYKSQYSTEYHMLKLGEHEDTRFKQMLKQIYIEMKNMKQIEENLKNERNKINESMEKMSEGISWAKSALVEWRQVMFSGDEANKMIDKLCRMDAGKAEALDSKRKLLHDSIVKQRGVLINLYEERKSLEILLERTSQLYRQAHLERRQLVNTWKDAVNQMNQREREIKDTENDVENAKKISIDKLKALNYEENTMKLKQNTNRDIELDIGELNIALSDLRNRLLKLDNIITLKNSELLALRKTVQNESQRLNNLRNQNRQMLTEEKDKENSLKSMIDDLRMIREKYEKFKGTNSDAQERLRQIEELLEMESKNMKKIEDDISRLCSALYRSEQQLKMLQQVERNLTIESQALESGISRARSSCKNFEKELVRQTEILYNVEYKIQHAEMRLSSMQGTIDEEENAILDERRTHLESVFADKVKADEIMKTQIARTEEDMRKLSTVYQNSISEYEKIIDKLKEKKIIMEGGEKQQKIIQHQNQEKLVEQNLLKIKIAQMEKLITKQADKAFSLEKHKTELEAAMNDRLIDIQTQLNILQTKRKCLIDERSQMKADIAERLLKIEQLKKRYACAIDLLGKNDDGTTVTAVQIKIEMAQEKFMLLNQGNELNEKIVKAQNEIKCMENALKLMNFSNDEYKKVFETIKEHSPEMQKMHNLQNQYHKTVNNIKEMKANLILLIDQLEILENQRQEVEKELDEVLRAKLDNNDSLLKIHKELLDQETKKERADREMKTAYKAAKRRLKDQDFMNLYTRNIEYKEYEERNNSALQQLADLVDNYNEMTQTVTRYFLERGLSLPTHVRRTKSQCSWKSETSLGDCAKRYSHRSIFSGSSAASSENSQTSKESVKVVTQQSGLSVIKITFPDEKRNVKKSSKTGKI